MERNRGQVFTVEAVLAALVVLAGLGFALQAVVLTPSTSGASESPTDAGELDSLLRQAVESGDLREAVTDWGGGGFQGTDAEREYFTANYSRPNTNTFVRTLGTNFDRTVTFNVVVYYRDNGTRARQRMVYNGPPGEGAVRASADVTLYDHGDTAAYATNMSGAVYNVMEVEVVAWRG